MVDTVTSGITLKAHWSIDSYTVTFDSDGGSLVDAQQVNYGDKATVPATPNKTGCAFAGWYLDSTQWDFLVDTVTSDITLKAHWSIGSYTVTFDSDGGSAVGSQTVDYGGLAAEPAAPIKANYTFTGWTLDSVAWDFMVNTVTTDITLKATWALNELDLDNRKSLTTDTTNYTYLQDTVAGIKINYESVKAGPGNSFVFGGSDGEMYMGTTISNDSTTAIVGITEITAVFSGPATLRVYTGANHNNLLNYVDLVSGVPATFDTLPYFFQIRYESYNTDVVTLTSLAIKYSGVAANDIMYKLSPDESYYICETYSGTITDIVIPAVHNTKPVKAIADWAFSSCDSLTNVVIPNSITSIGERAFYNSKMTSVTIPNSVTSLGDYAFCACRQLASVTFEAGMTLTSIPRGSFYYCDSLSTIIVPSGVSSLLFTSFMDSGLTSIVLPASLTLVDESSFDYCDGLKTVYFEGTAGQWSLITFKSYNEELTGSTLYCYSETYSAGGWHYEAGVPTLW